MGSQRMRRLWDRLRIPLTILVTFVVTSIFWIVVYSGSRSVEGSPGPAAEVVANLPPGQAVTATIEGPAQLVVGPSGLAIPVAGKNIRDLVDTYTQSRGGGARVHNAIDIMADRGTPVISAAPGTVEKLYFSEGGGGISAYVRSEDGQWMYYYAHLDAYAPGLKEGQKVARGAPIGTVGFSGNANPAGPHLHFAVNRMAPGEKWHQGTPVNPYPLLAGTPAGR
jgi:murein DD-endopeptidase MepM/ murein hydrolase activator NlpD